MIQYKVSKSVLCLSGALGLMFSAMTIAAPLASTNPPKLISLPTNQLAPPDLINGITVHNSTQENPLVTLENTYGSFWINVNGIQLGSVDAAGNPINGRLYLDNGTELTLKNDQPTNQENNISITGSGTPAILKDCTYNSVNCSVFQVGAGSVLGIPGGDINVGVPSGSQTQKTVSYGKLIIQGKANANAIFLGGSDSHGNLAAGMLVVSGSDAKSAELDVGKISLSSFSLGNGIVQLGPNADVQAVRFTIGRIGNFSKNQQLLSKNQLIIKGPNTRVETNSLLAGDVSSRGQNNTAVALPVEISVVNGAQVNVTGDTGIGLSGNDQSPLTFTIGGFTDTANSEVNLTSANKPEFSMSSPKDKIVIGPKGTLNLGRAAQVELPTEVHAPVITLQIGQHGSSGQLIVPANIALPNGAVDCVDSRGDTRPAERWPSNVDNQDVYNCHIGSSTTINIKKLSQTL